MNEMDLLGRLREEVPHGVSPHAEHLFQTALASNLESERAGVTRPARSLVRRGGDGIRALRPAWRLAVIAALAAGLAAGLVVGTRPGARAPAPAQPVTLTAKLLADQAASAALSGPDIRPGQWVYRKIGFGRGTKISEVWATADDLAQASYIKGTLLTCSWPSTCHPADIGGQSFVMAWPGTHEISYADLGSLPAGPRALLSRLESICAASGTGDRYCHPFTLIGELFFAYLMPPALTAELFQALGDVPGVTVVRDAVDLAGRHGVAFRLPTSPSGAYEEIILDPRTYQFMGMDSSSAAGPDRTAVLALAPVSGPGIRP
jgi:hypothetical protein